MFAIIPLRQVFGPPKKQESDQHHERKPVLAIAAQRPEETKVGAADVTS